MTTRYDLLIRAGRVFCSETGLDGPGAVAINGDRIVATGPDVDGTARDVREFPDGIVLPGLVDMHAHPAPSSWKYGIDADTEILPRGVTTVLSQGDAGAANWPEYRENIVRKSRTRIRMAISVSKQGEAAPSGPAFENLADLDVRAAVAAIRSDPELVWGVSVNGAAGACGSADPREVLARTIEIAEETGRPILFGNRWEPFDWPIEEQLDLLRRGDVLTYCFHVGPNAIVENGRVIDAAWRARERGVLFDAAHGMMSLNFDVAEAAIREGFFPDTISTDQYKRHVGSEPQHDLPRTASKLIAAGLPEQQALTRITANPARTLGLAGEVGTLAAGACADIAVLRWNPHAAPLVDVQGNSRPGSCLEPAFVVRNGTPIS